MMDIYKVWQDQMYMRFWWRIIDNESELKKQNKKNKLILKNKTKMPQYYLNITKLINNLCDIVSIPISYEHVAIYKHWHRKIKMIDLITTISFRFSSFFVLQF